MKIITYNIWNSDCNYNDRIELLCTVLRCNGADVIALQEVRDKETVDLISTSCGYKHYVWRKYLDCEEGLALLSKYPIIYAETNWENGRDVLNSFILRAVIEYNNKKIGITNMHLDYESALSREIEVVNGIKLIEKYEYSDYEVLLGDLNSYPESSVCRYLTGQQSLNNHGTTWIDLYKIYTMKVGEKPKATLDFLNNPRWDNESVLEIPGRFDYIMLKYPYPKKNPKLISACIIGDKRESNITPSDHYGVMCEVDFMVD